MNSQKSARIWSAIVLGIALLLVAATAYAIAGSRFDLVAYPTAFAWLRYIGQAGGVALIGSLAVLLASLKTRESAAQLRAGLAALVLALLVGTMVLNQVGPPPEPFMNDITTDLEDPPVFKAVLGLRPASSNPAAYGGEEVAAKQRLAHPEIVPIQSSLPPAEAFARAAEVARDMGWNIVAEDADTGILEAVATTPFFRFKDDVVVRVRPSTQGSRIDLRSHSRIGLTDLGKNAARIVEFSELFSGN